MIRPMPTPSLFRTGVAAVLAGSLFFAGHVGELVFGSSGDDNETVYVVLATAGIAALAVALWGLRPLTSASKKGRVGIRLALTGVGLLVLFCVQAVISVARTGDVPDNFILFALGFLLLLIGHVLFAPALRGALGRGSILPLVAAAGVIVAITTENSIPHDGGLIVFEGAWVALGIALVRWAGTPDAAGRRDAGLRGQPAGVAPPPAS